MGKEGLTPFCYAAPPADLNFELYTNLNKLIMKKRNPTHIKPIALVYFSFRTEYDNTLLTIRLAACHSTEEMLVILQIGGNFEK